MNNIEDMNRDEFFALLTDDAATPSPQFIESLRGKVSQAAGGSTGPGNGLFGGLKHFVLIAVVSAAVLTGFTSMQTAPPTANTTTPTDASTVIGGTSPGFIARQAGAELDGDTPQDPATTESGQVVDDQLVTNPVPTDQTAEDTADLLVDSPDEPVLPVDSLPDDIPFTVAFWNVSRSSIPPVMQDGAPDDIVTGIDELNFVWGAESPTDSGIIEPDFFVARAVATKYLFPGEYQLNMTIDDGVRVYINDDLVYDRWSTDASFASEQVQFSVDDNPEIVVRIEYYESTDSATLIAVIESL